MASASARDAQEWVVSCPSTVRAHENQDHGCGSRALKPQLSAAALHQSKTHYIGFNQIIFPNTAFLSALGVVECAPVSLKSFSGEVSCFRTEKKQPTKTKQNTQKKLKI